MDTQKVAIEYRMSQWVQIIQAREDSGQSRCVSQHVQSLPLSETVRV